jgi:ribosomal protein S18 acetylase RimI-like enzyme
LDQRNIDCIERTTHSYWSSLGSARGMEAHDDGDIKYVMPGPGRSGPAYIYEVHLQAETAEARVDAIIAAMRARALPSGIMLTPGSTPTDLADILVRKRFVPDETGLCMAVQLPSPGVPLRNGERIRTAVVEDAEALTHWAGIINVALVGEEIMSREQFSDVHALPGTRFFLAYHDGIPAAAAMTNQDRELVNVDTVATLEAYRGNGLGSAVTAAALRDATARGGKVAALRSRADAASLYRRLGFSELGPWACFYWPRNQ